MIDKRWGAADAYAGSKILWETDIILWQAHRWHACRVIIWGGWVTAFHDPVICLDDFVMNCNGLYCDWIWRCSLLTLPCLKVFSFFISLILYQIVTHVNILNHTWIFFFCPKTIAHIVSSNFFTLLFRVYWCLEANSIGVSCSWAVSFAHSRCFENELVDLFTCEKFVSLLSTFDLSVAAVREVCSLHVFT